jgi:flagellar hook-length control protein FliK
MNSLKPLDVQLPKSDFTKISNTQSKSSLSSFARLIAQAGKQDSTDSVLTHLSSHSASVKGDKEDIADIRTILKSFLAQYEDDQTFPNIKLTVSGEDTIAQNEEASVSVQLNKTKTMWDFIEGSIGKDKLHKFLPENMRERLAPILKEWKLAEASDPIASITNVLIELENGAEWQSFFQPSTVSSAVASERDTSSAKNMQVDSQQQKTEELNIQTKKQNLNLTHADLSVNKAVNSDASLEDTNTSDSDSTNTNASKQNVSIGEGNAARAVNDLMNPEVDDSTRVQQLARTSLSNSSREINNAQKAADGKQHDRAVEKQTIYNGGELNLTQQAATKAERQSGQEIAAEGNVNLAEAAMKVTNAPAGEFADGKQQGSVVGEQTIYKGNELIVTQSEAPKAERQSGLDIAAEEVGTKAAKEVSTVSYGEFVIQQEVAAGMKTIITNTEQQQVPKSSTITLPDQQLNIRQLAENRVHAVNASTETSSSLTKNMSSVLGQSAFVQNSLASLTSKDLVQAKGQGLTTEATGSSKPNKAQVNAAIQTTSAVEMLDVLEGEVTSSKRKLDNVIVPLSSRQQFAAMMDKAANGNKKPNSPVLHTPASSVNVMESKQEVSDKVAPVPIIPATKSEQLIFHLKTGAVNPEETGKELLQKLEQAFQGRSDFRLGASELSIRLRPHNLGDLQIKLLQQDGQTMVHIMTTSRQSKDMLEANIGQLKHLFAPHQVTITERQDQASAVQPERSYEQSNQNKEQSNKQQQQQEQERNNNNHDEQSFAEFMSELKGAAYDNDREN